MNQQILIFACLGSILLIASYTDIRNHRIANMLTIPSALIGIVLNSYIGSGIGFASSFYGLLLGLLCFLPFYVTGGMAAGDVKLMGAVGAFVGTPLILQVVLATLICGSIMGIVWLSRMNGLGEFLRRYLKATKYTFSTGSLHYLPPEKGSVALNRFPYAIAIASGTVLAIAFSS